MASRSELSLLGNLVITLTLLLLVAIGLPSLTLFEQAAGYLPLHTAAEAIAILAMLGVVVVYVRLPSGHPEAGRIAILAAGCLAVALIDLLHTLAYQGMPAFFTPSNPQKAINFWLAGRFWMAVSLAMTVVFNAALSRSAILAIFMGNLALAGLVFWLGSVHEASLPTTFIQGQGLTPIKIGAEIVIAVIFAFASWRCFLKPKSPEGSINWRLLAAAAWIFAIAELYLCLYSSVSDFFNIAGHIHKVVASILVLAALRPVAQKGLAQEGTSAGYSRSQ